MFWTYDHEAILCREVVKVNPYTTKKGSTQRRKEISLFSTLKSAFHTAESLFASEKLFSYSPSEEKEDYSACMLRKEEQTLLRL